MGSAPIDPETLIAEASRGSREAQSALMDCALMWLLDDEATQRRGCHVAEVFARLAAAHGRPEDKRRLAGILITAALAADNAGDGGEASRLAVDAFVLLDELADAGDDDAAEKLALLSTTVGPHIIQAAAEVVRERAATSVREA